MQTDLPPIEKQQPHRVSVHGLVEFVLQTGDLTPGGFQRRDRAQLGTMGHKRVQRSRPEDYQSEVPISFWIDDDQLPIEVQGRIDGLYADRDPVILEEIKTTAWPLHLIHEDHNPLHWAQAQCYAAMYVRQFHLGGMTIHLTYYQLDTGEEKTFARHYVREDLEIFFEDLTARYLSWFRKIHAIQVERNESIEQLEFPYDGYRAGQREMAVEVYKSIRSGGFLYAQSPTGVGKTIAALFPSVKSLGQGLAEKIFYLTAKTSGRASAEKALKDMRRAGLHLKSVTLTAKEKICFCPPVNCDPEICAYARGYFDKRTAALEEIDHRQDFSRVVIEDMARRYEICPFELSLDLALWVDCIICDYNYAFDPRVYLHRFFDRNITPYIFLVDEAHNLPDRAREMYSAQLDKKEILNLQRALKPHLPELAKALNAINKTLLEIRKTCQAEGRTALVEYELPQPLLQAVRQFHQWAEDWLALNQDLPFRQELLDFYFSCSNYLRTAEYFDSFYVSYFELQKQGNLKARLFCLDPAPLLAGPLERSRSTIFFSATLLPLDYFMKLLTGSADHPKRIYPSPFPIKNAGIWIHNRIFTSFLRRAESYSAIAEAIDAVCSAHPGNYLIFFPSYAYLTAVLEPLKEKLKEEQIIVQKRGMLDAERESFLARFSSSNTETLVGLAVMGGVFGEGIDLVGDRLVGAVVVGVGIPQVGLENDLIKTYFDRQNENGFAYAYQYPGFNRVLQATGRVIRTEEDRGIIVLMDERFTQERYRRLFPAHWSGFEVVQTTTEIKEKLARFWLYGDNEAR